MTSSLKNIPLRYRVSPGLTAPSVEDEYIAVKNGTISWIDPTTGTQIREIKTGYNYTRFASSSCKGEIYTFTIRGQLMNVFLPMSYDVDISVTIRIMAARPIQPVTFVCKIISFGRNTLY
jgi:DNA-binding beta-propeller fold protein YncE